MAYLFRQDKDALRSHVANGKHTVTQYRSQPLLIFRDRENASENDDRAWKGDKLLGYEQFEKFTWRCHRIDDLLVVHH